MERSPLLQQQAMEERTAQQRMPRWVFVVLLAVSLLIRLLALSQLAGVPLVSDAEDYRQMAVLLASGQHFVPYWPPGLPLYLLPWVAGGAGLLVLRATMLFWWLLLCLGLVRAARLLDVPDRITLALLAIFSLTPAMVHLSIEPLTQLTAAALLLWAVGAALACVRRASVAPALELGLSLGVLVLVRPSALPLLVVVPALLWWRVRRQKAPLLAVALSALLVLSWSGYAHRLSGSWALNHSNGINAFYGNNPWTPLYRTWYFGSHAKPGTTEIEAYPEYAEVLRSVSQLPQVERSAAFSHLATQEVLHNPGRFLLRSLNRARCFWGFDSFTASNLRAYGGEGRRWFPLALLLDAACYLAVAGFAFFWIAAAPGRWWRQWTVWLLSSVILLYALPYWVTMSHPTYHLPVVAPLALLGALAWRQREESVRVRGWIALAVLALIQLEWVLVMVRSRG